MAANGTAPPGLMEDALYAALRARFLAWYLPGVVAVGLVGHAACIAALLYRRFFPAPVALWLVSVCVGDLLVLALDASRHLVMALHPNDLDLRDASPAWCRLGTFLAAAALHWLAAVQSAFSVQRLIAVLRPERARRLLTWTRVRAAWLALLPVALLPNVPYLVGWRLEARESGRRFECRPESGLLFGAMALLHSILWGLAPLTVMAMSTLIIVVQVSRRHRVLVDLSANKNNINNNNSRSVRTNSAAVTRLLILLNVWYVVTTFPYLAFLLQLNFGPPNHPPRSRRRFILYLLRAILYLNPAFNWVFYAAAGPAFRRSARLLWARIRRSPSRSQTDSSVLETSMAKITLQRAYNRAMTSVV